MTPHTPSCPHLPRVDTRWPAAALAGHDASRDPSGFFTTALRCAQSRWMEGLPAQSLLMINRAFSVRMDDADPLHETFPWPYAAVAWILTHADNDHFLGNPRRHYQHLATRMNSGPAHALRVARAWACWAIARRLRPEFPADEEQLADGQMTEPGEESIAGLPAWRERPRERACWLACLEQTMSHTREIIVPVVLDGSGR